MFGPGTTSATSIISIFIAQKTEYLFYSDGWKSLATVECDLLGFSQIPWFIFVGKVDSWRCDFNIMVINDRYEFPVFMLS